MHAEEIGLLLKQERGQFLEFVSAYEYRRGGTQKRRDEELAREIVRVLSGMANADGGTLLVGVEPDRSVTGIPYETNEVRSLIQAPQTLLTPPLNLASVKIRLGNLLLIKFEVTSALEVYRVTGGRSFYRISTETPSLPAEQIQTLREAKRSVLYERHQPLNAAWEDLDQTAIADLTARIQDSRPPEAILAHSYHLVDASRRPSIPNMAGLLLFAKDPAFWHPRCGIDFVTYVCTERQHSAALNIVKRIIFEAIIVILIVDAVGRIKEHVRERTVLHDL